MLEPLLPAVPSMDIRNRTHGGISKPALLRPLTLPLTVTLISSHSPHNSHSLYNSCLTFPTTSQSLMTSCLLHSAPRDPPTLYRITLSSFPGSGQVIINEYSAMTSRLQVSKH